MENKPYLALQLQQKPLLSSVYFDDSNEKFMSKHEIVKVLTKAVNFVRSTNLSSQIVFNHNYEIKKHKPEVMSNEIMCFLDKISVSSVSNEKFYVEGEFIDDFNIKITISLVK